MNRKMSKKMSMADRSRKVGELAALTVLQNMTPAQRSMTFDSLPSDLMQGFTDIMADAIVAAVPEAMRTGKRFWPDVALMRAEKLLSLLLTSSPSARINIISGL